MNVENGITIFTPTFNRGYIIGKLYSSLKKQYYKNFEWLVIDDGSTDNTEEIISEYIKENSFEISYYKKANEGKHIAINMCAEVAQKEWIFIVDSDDYLTEDALVRVNYYINTIKDSPSYAGVVGLRGDSDNHVWSTSNPNVSSDQFKINNAIKVNEYIDASSIDYRYKYKIKGDRAEVVRKDILRKYKFPKFNNEKFLPENYLWINLAMDGYIFRWFNEVIYITEYLEDGLTRNGKLQALNNPLGKSFSENVELKVKDMEFIDKLKHSINYYRYGHIGGVKYSTLFHMATNKSISLVSLPISILLSIKGD